VARTALIILVGGLAFAQSERGITRGPSPAFIPAGGHYYALVIGIDEYRTLPHLHSAIADARSVETVLRDGYGFETKLLLDSDATRGSILRALNEYRTRLHQDDHLLLYYAGHGYRDPQADRAYWLPQDSDSSPANWISADDLAAAVRALPALHVLIVSDSCYSGGLAGSRAVHLSASQEDHLAYLRKLLASKSRTFMSSGGDEPVADNGPNGHSVFTGAFLRGLRELEGTAFSAENLFDWYVREPVGGSSKQTPQFGVMRDTGHDMGDFVFAGSKASPEAPTEPDAGAGTELAYWNAIDKKDPDSLKLYLRRFPNGKFADVAQLAVARLSG